MKGMELAKAIAAGDLTQRLNLDQRDEVGQLTAAMDHAAESFARIVFEIHKLSDELGSSATDLSQVSHGLLAQSEEMSIQASNVAGGAEQMTGNINTMAAAAEEMSRNVSSISSASEQISVNVGTISAAAQSTAGNVQTVGRRRARSHPPRFNTWPAKPGRAPKSPPRPPTWRIKRRARCRPSTGRRTRSVKSPR